MFLVIPGRLRKESGAGNEPISSRLHDRWWLPSLLPEEQGWAVQAHICTLSSFSCESTALPCSPVPCSSWQAIRRTVLAAELLLQGCLRRAAVFVVGKCAEGGGWQGRQKGLWRQMAMCTESSACVGNSVWEVAQPGAAFPLAVQAGSLLWHLHHGNNLLPCVTLLIWGGHTISDLLTCLISSTLWFWFWDFSGCNTPFWLFWKLLGDLWQQ